MSLVNYLGTYETLDQVWEAYPEGGKEGDYLYIASVLKKWNKYTSAWADPTEEDVEGSTIVSLEEDVVVGSSTLINYLGRFETLENALNAYPEGGNEGDYIYVGDDIYAWDKYANEWVVSSDAPLEVAISEEDIIPNSNTFINYLGGFVDKDAVWQKYPEGGKVGDYLYIASDLHIWDKYICNWVAATPPDKSSQIRPIEVLTQEGVVEYSENYINYLGVFESIEQAWEAYPEGGKEGDYIIVGGEQLRWNKYTSNWGEYDPDESTPARPVATIYGDLHVHNDVIIGEDLYARILETFTTKKWVLEQGYISLDDVTSELVMSKIVPDNTTIEVRDGKLVVIGGGGGGTADSVAWDNITGKPDWIGNTKPTYTLDEIAGSNGDGFVTLLSDQIIEGVKNFANGAKFNGALLSYDEEKKAWVFPGNIIASGGITAFGSLSTPVVSLFEALPIDGTTIKRDPITNELYVDTNVVGGSGGGSLDEEQLEEFLRPYATIEYVSNNYTTKTSVDKALSDKANKATTLAGYGITDAYTKSHIDSNFVTIGTKQRITGEKDFVGGFKVNGGLLEYNASLKAWTINGDLLVTGGVSAFSNISDFKPSTITEAVLIDNKTIKLNADGLLYAVAPETDGINEEQLADYLTTNGYATQSWVTGKGYITGITGTMVTNALGYAPLNKTGDVLTLKANQFTGAYALDMQNSNIVNLNALFTSDVANDPTEGIQFKRTNGNFDSLWVADGIMYFSPNGNNAEMTGEYATSYAVLHSGNYSNYALPINGGTVKGQITSDAVENFVAKGADYSLYFGISTGQVNRGIYDLTNNSWMLYRDATNNVIIPQGEVIVGNSLAAVPVGSIHRLRLIADNAATYIQAGSASGSNAGVLRLTGYYASQLTALRLHAQAVEATGTLEVTGGITAPIFSGVASNATYWNAPSSIRPTTANVPVVGNTTFSHFLATSSMTTGKPSNDGYIIHGEWDTVVGWSSQLFFANGSPDPNNRMQWRAMDSGTWGEWKSVAFIDTEMLKPIQGLQINHIGSNYAEGIRLANRNGTSNTWSEINFGCDPSATTGTHATQWTVGRNGNNNYFVIRNFGTDRIQIDLSGNTTLTGNFVATGGVTAQNSSDRRLKRNIRKFNASKVLMSLGGVWEYEYIDSEVQKNSIYEGTHYGLIYQHVKGTTLDVMCREREDGFGTLNYIHPKFISLIAGATMENISEVEKLKRKIRHLENKVKQLEQRV